LTVYHPYLGARSVLVDQLPKSATRYRVGDPRPDPRISIEPSVASSGYPLRGALFNVFCPDRHLAPDAVGCGDKVDEREVVIRFALPAGEQCAKSVMPVVGTLDSPALRLATNAADQRPHS
jgi:hypothetical protein